MKNSSPRKNVVEEQAQCDPSKAIPLHYFPLEREPSLAVYPISTSSANGDFLWDGLSELSTDDNKFDEPVICSQQSWQLHSKTLLMKKSVITYFQLAKLKFKMEKFGFALQYLVKAILCFGLLLF